MRKFKELKRSWFESVQQRTIPGSPDVIGCVNGWFVGIEFKKSSKSPISMMQKYKLQKIVEAGGLGFICHPENFTTVLASLIEATHFPKI